MQSSSSLKAPASGRLALSGTGGSEGRRSGPGYLNLPRFLTVLDTRTHVRCRQIDPQYAATDDPFSDSDVLGALEAYNAHLPVVSRLSAAALVELATGRNVQQRLSRQLDEAC